MEKNSKTSHKEPKNGLIKQKHKNICVDKVENGGIMKPQKQMFVLFGGIFMSTLTFVSFIFNTVLVLLGAYAIYREKDLVKFERKVKKYVKAFFKALWFTALEKKQKNKTSVKAVENNSFDCEYNKIFNGVSEIEDVLVA